MLIYLSTQQDSIENNLMAIHMLRRPRNACSQAVSGWQVSPENISICVDRHEKIFVSKSLKKLIKFNMGVTEGK